MRRALTHTVALIALLGLSCGDGDGPLGTNGTDDPSTGGILVSLVMSGGDMDADGFTVTVDGGSSQQLNVGATIAFSHLAAGTHEIAIGNVAANCQADGGASRSVTVVAGETTRETFEVLCDWRSRIAFSSGPTSSIKNVDIFLMNPDGTGQVNLTNPDQEDDDWHDNDIVPIWSPDGTKIAFDRGYLAAGHSAGIQIYVFVINRDGTGMLGLTNDYSGEDENRAAWSPDGTQIAYRCGSQVCVINADGSGQAVLTHHAEGYGAAMYSSLDWSPDGARIVYSCYNPDGTPDICAVSTDGSGWDRLTNSEGHDRGPDWSPDGTRIAFVRDKSMWVMNPDGTDQIWMMWMMPSDERPTWSPDGSRIAFVFADHVYVIDRDGTDLVQLFFGYHPSWSFDGARIVFECPTNSGRGICVIDADGTNRTQLTSNYESKPSWSPDLY